MQNLGKASVNDQKPNSPKTRKRKSYVKSSTASYDGYSTNMFRRLFSNQALFTSEAERQKFLAKYNVKPLRYPIAENILKKFGSMKLLKDSLDATMGDKAPNLTTLYRWIYPREKGGTDGQIPTKNIPNIMLAARFAGVMLEPEDFYPTREMPSEYENYGPMPPSYFTSARWIKPPTNDEDE